VGGNHEEVAKITLPNKAMVLAADDQYLYVLNHSSEVSILNASDLSTKLSKKLGYEATSLTVCGSSIWIGDKTGKIHVLDSTLTEVKLIEKHSKAVSGKEAVTCLASNGTVVAYGDANRYILVLNG
jgi:hypothetical protein